jgi:hypothetical protein
VDESSLRCEISHPRAIASSIKEVAEFAMEVFGLGLRSWSSFSGLVFGLGFRAWFSGCLVFGLGFRASLSGLVFGLGFRAWFSDFFFGLVSFFSVFGSSNSQ